MRNLKVGKVLLSITLLFGVVLISSANEALEAAHIFKKKCSLCHAVDKQKLGPAIKSMSQEKNVLLQILTQGRNSMPGFEGKLTREEINSVVDYLLLQQNK